MRFSSALAPKLPQEADGPIERAQAAQETPVFYQAAAAAPWPAGEPPDDLDQRVRQIGEW